MQEVLFLDADSFPLTKPDDLFEYQKYKETGAVFWQDYWDPEPASQVSSSAWPA